MQFLNFIRDEPIMGGFALLAALLIIVPVLPIVWRRLSGRETAVTAEIAIKPATPATPTRFGNTTELLLVFVGAMILLALFFLVRSASAQTGTGLSCPFSPSDSRLDFAVGAKLNEIEIRIRDAVDPKKVVCLATVACMIKANPVRIYWEYRAGTPMGSNGPKWYDITWATVQYADGTREQCQIESALNLEALPRRSLTPEIDPKLRDFKIPE